MIWNTILVLIGGALGSAGRYLVSALAPMTSRQIPWSTLLINSAGSLLLGILLAVVSTRSHDHSQHPMYLLLGVGFCGGFTTMSAFAVETVTMINDGYIGMAIIYTTSTLILCTLYAALGLLLTKALLT